METKDYSDFVAGLEKVVKNATERAKEAMRDGGDQWGIEHIPYMRLAEPAAVEMALYYHRCKSELGGEEGADAAHMVTAMVDMLGWATSTLFLQLPDPEQRTQLAGIMIESLVQNMQRSVAGENTETAMVDKETGEAQIIRRMPTETRQ